MLDAANHHSISENNEDSRIKAGLGIAIHQNISATKESKYNVGLVDKYSSLANNEDKFGWKYCSVTDKER